MTSRVVEPAPHPGPDPALARQRVREHAPALLLVLFCALVGMAFVLAGQPGLPARFGYDADRIQAGAQPGAQQGRDRSFDAVSQVYADLGLGHDPVLAGFVTYVVFLLVVALTLVGRVVRRNRDLAVVAAVVLLGSVYLGQYSKDVFPALLVLPVLLRSRSRVVDLVLVVAMAWYAYEFRTYWLVVLALYVGTRLVVGATGPSWRRLALLAGAAVVAAGVAIPVLLGVPLDSFRTGVNADRLDGVDAATAIVSHVGGTSMGVGMANMAITLLSFAVPVPLLLLGSVYHAALAVLIGAFWFVVARSVGPSRGTPLDAPRARAIALLLAFTLVQAIFEPDYGSYVRHLLPLTPLALVLLLPTSVSRVEGHEEVR